MRNSNLEQLWQGNKILRMLKFLNLSHCYRLIRIPDFTKFPLLERLILKDCVNLVEVDESVKNAEGLVYLNLRDCKSLRKLPSNICLLKYLKTLIISGCTNLEMLPEETNKMESLESFHAGGISLDPLPRKRPRLSLASTHSVNASWHEFFWGLVSKPRKRPKLSWTSLPHSLVRLSLFGCKLSDNSFPRDFSNLPSLQYLNLSENLISCLPDCVRGLRSIQTLIIALCPRLQALEGIPTVEKSFCVMRCPLLEKITFQPNSYRAFSFNVCGCEKLVEAENIFKLENLNSEIISSLSFYDLESMKSIQMNLYNTVTKTETRGHIKGVYENSRPGILFSIFYPGNSVPSWFSVRSFQSSITFTMSSPHKYFDICIVYTIDRPSPGDLPEQFFVLLSNETKKIRTLYSPSCYGVPEQNEHMIWLSRWNCSSHQLEAGDELTLSTYNELLDFKVKEVGVHVVYYEQGLTQSNGGRDLFGQTTASQYVIPEDPLAYQGSTERPYYIGFSGCMNDIPMKEIP